MGFDYSIVVHDYITYTHAGPGPLILHSPQILRPETKTIIAQEQHGRAENKVLLVNASDVDADPDSRPHPAEAHGVVVTVGANGSYRRGDPVWIWDDAKWLDTQSGKIHVINLRTYEVQEIPLRDVVWKPDRESGDGLITFTGALPNEKKSRRKKARMCAVVVQKTVRPYDTKLEVMSTKALSAYKDIRKDLVRKRQLFENRLQQLGLEDFPSPPSSSGGDLHTQSTSSSFSSMSSDRGDRDDSSNTLQSVQLGTQTLTKEAVCEYESRIPRSQHPSRRRRRTSSPSRSRNTPFRASFLLLPSLTPPNQVSHN